MQIATWVLFGLQQAYFFCYLVLEAAIRYNSVAAGLITLAHLILSAAVVLLCIDVVRTDASRITPEEQSFLVE